MGRGFGRRHRENRRVRGAISGRRRSERVRNREPPRSLTPVPSVVGRVTRGLDRSFPCRIAFGGDRWQPSRSSELGAHGLSVFVRHGAVEQGLPSAPRSPGQGRRTRCSIIGIRFLPGVGGLPRTLDPSAEQPPRTRALQWTSLGTACRSAGDRVRGPQLDTRTGLLDHLIRRYETRGGPRCGPG